MNKFIRWYNQNRKKVWSILGIIVIIIVVIQLINNYYKQKNEEEISNSNEVQNITLNENYNNIRVDDNNSVLSGNAMSSAQEEQIQIIDTFVDYCNRGDVESAYQLITDECKQEMYPELDNFTNSYYNETFADSEKNVISYSFKKSDMINII